MRIREAVTALAMWCIAGSAGAFGFAENVKVDLVRVDADGRGYVAFVTPLTGSPATCGATHNRMLAFDTNSNAGRSIMSLALAAKATDRLVHARGTGACMNYGVVEDWSYGWIK